MTLNSYSTITPAVNYATTVNGTFTVGGSSATAVMTINNGNWGPGLFTTNGTAGIGVADSVASSVRLSHAYWSGSSSILVGAPLGEVRLFVDEFSNVAVSGGVTVDAGGYLEGSGHIGDSSSSPQIITDVTVNAGGTVSPGNVPSSVTSSHGDQPQIGTLFVYGDFTQNAKSTLQIDIKNFRLGGWASDSVSVTGTVILAGTVKINFLSNPAASLLNNQFTIVSESGGTLTDALTGVEGTPVGYGTKYYWHIVTGKPNSVVIEAVQFVGLSPTPTLAPRQPYSGAVDYLYGMSSTDKPILTCTVLLPGDTGASNLSYTAAWDALNSRWTIRRGGASAAGGQGVL